MTSYFNDSPIETVNDDRYGIAPFSESLAKSFLNIDNPVGTTIALHGPWGSGKSSVVNLVREFLNNENSERLVVSEFKCWWYRGEEALALAFLQNLNSILRTELKDKVKDLVPKLGRGLLQAGPVIGSAMTLTSAGAFGGLFTGAFDFTKRYFPEGDTLEQIFIKLSEILEKEDRRFLIIIDDIDRLSPEEVIGVFRLIKSVGRLPNVMYLLAFDRSLAEKVVREKYPSEGPHFLEKIIQAGFELPSPLSTDLNDAVLTAISEICGTPDEVQIVRFMNLFYDVVAPYITSPRHVNRLQNAISVTWPAIANEVNLADFIALETIRLYEPMLFNAIRVNKTIVCGNGQQARPHQNDDSRLDIFLQGVKEDHHELAKISLKRLFPSLENISYGGGEWHAEWKSERRVCIEAYFDTYFRLTLSDETLSSERMAKLISHADDRDFILSVFREAAQIIRRNGCSMVPVYLDEYTTHGKKIPKEKVVCLLSTLFEIHDEIDLEHDADKGFMAIATTSLRYHWLIRSLTRDRFDIEERTSIYLQALENASLGWLVNFTSSAISDYTESESRSLTREADCLVTEEALPELTGLALEKIRGAASDGTLLHHKDLLSIMFRWRDFMGNEPSEVRSWSDGLLEDPHALVVLVRALTGESRSVGMGGFGNIGDRVAKRSVKVHISNDTDILDIVRFRSALEMLVSSEQLDEDSTRNDVHQFLQAWGENVS